MSSVLGLVGLLRVASEARPVRRREAGALPTARLTLVRPDEVDTHRALGCSSYEGCLDAAYRHGWKSWTCERCPLFAGRGRRAGSPRAVSRPGARALRLLPTP